MRRIRSRKPCQSRMRGVIFAILWMIGITNFTITAQTIIPDQVYTLAANWMQHHSGRFKSSLQPDSVWIYTPAKSSAISPENKTNRIYLVTFQPAGFMIVTPGWKNNPVCGYSTEQKLPKDPAHPLNDYWLPRLYRYLNQDRVHIPPKINSSTSLKTDLAVDPLLTAQWGQGDPWNKFCPADDSGRHALVGCVAVAMSQIMYHWKWPEKGTGSNTYRPPAHQEYGEVTANFDTTHYRWNQMHTIYPTDAAALLLFQTGVATFMNYGPDESGSNTAAYALPAFKNNFSYHPGIIFREEEKYFYGEWTQMLRQELVNNRAVLYTGTNPVSKAGHAFNIDGFRDETFFHFNWGWNGAGNGYFQLFEMGGGSADFSNNQGAMFGIQPANLPRHDRPATLQALPGDTFVDLIWDNPVVTDLSHYVIYRNDTLIANTPDTRYRDTSLVNGTAYQYHITAVYIGQNPGESDPTPSLEVVPWTQITAPGQQDFETGLHGWQIDQNEFGFHIAAAAELAESTRTGSFVLIRSEGVGDGIKVSDYLISPVIYPRKYHHLAISFDYLFKQKKEVEVLYLMYRKFSDGLWNTIARLDSTGGWNDWKTFYAYIPPEAGGGPVQIGFYYNNYYREGFGAAIDQIRFFDVPEPPVPQFEISTSDACQDQTIIVSDSSTGHIENYFWDFGEGATPRYAQTKGPHQVVYQTAGHKAIRLTLNHLDQLDKKNILNIRSHPESGFTYTRSAMDIHFTNTGKNVEALFWDFGDGVTSTSVNPVHTYLSKEIFHVTQVGYNGTCSPDTTKVDLDMRPGTGIDDRITTLHARVYPNPFTGSCAINWETPPVSPVVIRITDLNGKEVFTLRAQPASSMKLYLPGLPTGIYILHLISGKIAETHRLIKMNPYNY
ncbi:MAG: C10 family peptidase [Bacteroidales bacterium]|nr:C10 family peptidase [Bacteroidales bacterium]